MPHACDLVVLREFVPAEDATQEVAAMAARGEALAFSADPGCADSLMHFLAYKRSTDGRLVLMAFPRPVEHGVALWECRDGVLWFLLEEIERAFNPAVASVQRAAWLELRRRSRKSRGGAIRKFVRGMRSRFAR